MFVGYVIEDGYINYLDRLIEKILESEMMEEEKVQEIMDLLGMQGIEEEKEYIREFYL